MENKIIKRLKMLCDKAYKKGEVPVAALIVKDNRIVSEGYNRKNSDKNPLLHAEIIAIIKASRKIRDWRLNDCVMYVTLKPCKMCEEIIKESRISQVYYILDRKSEKSGNLKYIKIKNNEEVFKNKIETFFKERR